MKPIYSIDKIVIEALTTQSEAQTIMDNAIAIHGEENVEIYGESFRQSSYRHSYKVVMGEEQTAFIQYRHNMEKPNANLRYKFRVEFNPNKVNSDPFLDVILHHFTYMPPRYVNIVRADIAMDYPVGIENIRVFRHGKSRHMIYREQTVTHYLGKGENRVKIYDKQAERKRLNIDIPVTTRIEVTRPVRQSLSTIGQFQPSEIPHHVYILPQQLDIENILMDPVARCLLYGLDHGVVTIQDFKWKKKKDLIEVLEKHWEKITLPPEMEIQILMETLKTLFPIRFIG